MSDLVLMHQQQGIAELMARAHARFLDCKDLTPEEAERLGEAIATIARDVQFWAGDLARYSEARWPDTHFQCWPAWVSPGMLARTAGVCRAYPKEADRQHNCTYSQFLQVAGKPDRQKLLAEMVGLTTDETRKPKWKTGTCEECGGELIPKTKNSLPAPLASCSKCFKEYGYWGEVQRGTVPTAEPNVPAGNSAPRWLLAIDVNYFLHRFWHSGAGVEAAGGVASWVTRTVARLKEKGLTDVACCFDAPDNHRKKLTEGWEDGYKQRPPKDPELAQQLNLVRDLLCKANFACVSVEGMEADDVMASYAKQFDGKITLLTQDKDCRQCLSGKCNILLDVTWSEDDTSGEHLPDYKWLTSKTHTETTGIPPEKWVDYQTIMGDNCDGIRGVEGIGQKGAADLVKEFGTVEAVIAAAKAGAASITPKKREAIVAFEPKLAITRQLVTLKTDLTVPNSTRI
jgi:5'-3' exonuclease